MAATCPTPQDHGHTCRQRPSYQEPLEPRISDMPFGEACRRVMKRADRSLTRSACACRVLYHRRGLVLHFPPGIRQPAAKISILPVHPVVLVKSADLFEGGGSDQHAGPGYPIDPATPPACWIQLDGQPTCAQQD